jgi:hypothetical protein
MKPSNISIYRKSCDENRAKTVDFNGARTNNVFEGWHHRFNSNICTSNPNLYTFIDGVKKDYAFTMAEVGEILVLENK